MMSDNYGIMAMATGSGDIELDEVYVTANYCDTHNKFYGHYSSCSKCDEYAIDSQFYDAKYGSLGYDNYDYSVDYENTGDSGVISGGGHRGRVVQLDTLICRLH